MKTRASAPARPGFLQVLRSLVFDAVFYIGTFVLSITLIWTLLLPRKAMLRVLKACYFDMIGVAERYLLGLDYRVMGREHAPTGQAYIVAAKHQSAWETLKLLELFDDPAIVLKHELLRIPLWGWYAARADLIPIDRSAGTSAVDSLIAGSRHAAAQKRPMVIFPQGTRVKPGVFRRYKQGVALVYEALDLPVLPVAMNSGVFWPRGAFVKKGGTITVEFLEPIPPGLGKEALLARLETVLEAESDRLVQEAGGPPTVRNGRAAAQPGAVESAAGKPDADARV